jgi:hypothetical protein
MREDWNLFPKSTLFFALSKHISIGKDENDKQVARSNIEKLIFNSAVKPEEIFLS